MEEQRQTLLHVHLPEASIEYSMNPGTTHVHVFLVCTAFTTKSQALGTIFMPRCACASEVYGSVCCACVCVCVCVRVCLCRLLQLLKNQ